MTKNTTIKYFAHLQYLEGVVQERSLKGDVDRHIIKIDILLVKWLSLEVASSWIILPKRLQPISYTAKEQNKKQVNIHDLF